MECGAGVGRDPAGVGPGYRSGCGRIARPLIHDLYAALVLAKINGSVATSVQSVGVRARAVERCNYCPRPQVRVALHRRATLPVASRANAWVRGLNQCHALTGADRPSNVLGVVSSNEASSRHRLRHRFGGAPVGGCRKPRAKARVATLPTLNADRLRQCRTQGCGERSGHLGRPNGRREGRRHQAHLGTRRLQDTVKVWDQDVPSRAVAYEVTGWIYNPGCGYAGDLPSWPLCRCLISSWHSHLSASWNSNSENQHHRRPLSLLRSASCIPPLKSTARYRTSVHFALSLHHEPGPATPGTHIVGARLQGCDYSRADTIGLAEADDDVEAFGRGAGGAAALRGF